MIVPSGQSIKNQMKAAMSNARLLDVDPLTGVKTEFIGSEDGDSFSLRYSQDCEPILDANKAKKSMGRDYYARDDEMWRVASIPASIQMKWMVENGVDTLNPDHWQAVKKLLNDPEWMHLKTADITI